MSMNIKKSIDVPNREIVTVKVYKQDSKMNKIRQAKRR